LKTVILTGFEPFGQDTINPALKVLAALREETIPDVKLITLQLPVVFGKAYKLITDAITKEKPHLVLSIGQAGGRSAINVEKVGVNIDDARIADNAGNTPKDEVITKDGPAAYFTTIDVRGTVEKIKQAGIPAIISYSAGTYVCNNVVFGTLHFLVTTNQDIKYGFIHVPYLPEQVATKPQEIPSMSLSLIKEAIRIAILANL